MTIVEICVHMDCAGCESKIRRALQKLEGIDDIDIDMARQKVTVTGYVDQKKVLKAVRKTGRRAVLWPYPYAGEHQGYYNHNSYHYQHHPALASSYHYQHHPALASHPYSYSAPSSSYNYYKHGYDDASMHGYDYHQANYAYINEKTTTMFSDDNTAGCSIM